MSLTVPLSGKHDGIDALRGFAALIVVLFHMNQTGFGVVDFAWTQAGILGVDLFFTLSGFLIARCIMTPAQFEPRQYLESRARRILPSYFIALFLVIAVVDVRSLMPMPVSHAAGDLAVHVLLIHGWFTDYAISIMGPFWTLSHEWWFYLLMLAAAPLLRSRRWWMVPLLMTVLAVGSRLGHLQHWWSLPCGLKNPLSLWDQFAAGIVAAGLTLKCSTSPPAKWVRPALLAAGSALICWSMWKVCREALTIDPLNYVHKGPAFGAKAMGQFLDRRSNVLWFSPVLASGTAMLVAGLTLGKVRRWRWPLMPWMGQISFSTYLYHMPVVLCYGRAYKIVPQDSVWLLPWASFLLVLGMVYALSFFAWHFFEKPWLKRAA